LDNASYFGSRTNHATQFLTNNTVRATIDSSGRLLVNTTASRAQAGLNLPLFVEGTNYTGIGACYNAANSTGSFLALSKSRGAANGSNTIVNNNDQIGEIYFSAADGTDLETRAATIAAFVDGVPGSNDMPGRLVFSTTADGAATPTERMRINSSGNLLVGTTTQPNGTVDGFQASSNGVTYISADGIAPVALYRGTSDGNILNFHKDGTAVGSIGVISSDLAIYSTTAGHHGLRFAAGQILPTNNAGTIVDNQANLGDTSFRFKDLYLSGSVYLGGTTSANALDDYEEGTWTPSVGGTATYNAGNYGRYVKVGNIVSLQFCIDIALIGTGSATSVTNLPFTSENIGSVQTGCVSYFANLNTSTNFIAFYVDNNATSITFVGNTGNTATVSLNGFSIFQNGTEVFGAVTYRTA
jgi:hypothetical protein